MSNHQVWLDITRKGLWTDRNVCKGFCFTDSITGTSAFSSSGIRSAPHVLSSQEAPHLHCFLMSVARLPKAPYLGSSSAPGLQNLQKFRDSIKAPVTSSVYHTQGQSWCRWLDLAPGQWGSGIGDKCMLR